MKKKPKLSFDESKDFTVLHAGDDGDEGIKEILNIEDFKSLEKTKVENQIYK